MTSICMYALNICAKTLKSCLYIVYISLNLRYVPNIIYKCVKTVNLLENYPTISHSKNWLEVHTARIRLGKMEMSPSSPFPSPEPTARNLY